MPRILLRLLAILAVLACTVFLMPSSVPLAGAETLEIEPYEWENLTDSAEPLEMGEVAPLLPLEEGFLPDNAGYRDETLSVSIRTMRAFDTKVFLTYIRIADPTQLRTASAKPGAFDKGEKPTKTIKNADIIAKRVHAVLAINGDYFCDRKEGVIYRNGVEIRSADFGVFDALIIDQYGDFHIMKNATQEDVQALEAEGLEVMHSFSFGPGLVIDGERQTDYNAGTMGGNKKKAQRQVLCQVGPLSYLVVTTHGPEQNGSEGLTLVQLGDLLEALQVRQAYNLDGGSSTWLVLNDKKINHKSKRGIGDIIYFATASTGEGE